MTNLNDEMRMGEALRQKRHWSLRGVKTPEIDMNKFTGTLEEYEQFKGLSSVPPSAPTFKTIKIKIAGDAVYEITEE